jgi:hypothetical protein
MLYDSIYLSSGYAVKWSANSAGSGDAFAATDLILLRDSPRVSAWRDGVNPNTNRVYGRYISSGAISQFLEIGADDLTSSNMFVRSVGLGTNSRPLSLGGTNGAQHLTILPNGNVGILTNQPQSALHVHGQLEFGGAATIYAPGTGKNILINASSDGSGNVLIQRAGSTVVQMGYLSSGVKVGSGGRYQFSDGSDMATAGYATALYQIGSSNTNGLGKDVPNGTLLTSNAVFYGGVAFRTNGLTAVAIEAGLNNGDFWQGTISNGLNVAWKSNSVVLWKVLAP